MDAVEFTGAGADKPRWRENVPFWAVHAVALAGAFWVGWSWQAAAWLAGKFRSIGLSDVQIQPLPITAQVWEPVQPWEIIANGDGERLP